MFVHRSSNLEELINRLDESLKEPALDLLEPEILLIQSAGMERYLSRELARRGGIAANLRFPYPRAFLREVLDRALGECAGAFAFERQNLAWALYFNLQEHLESSSPVFAPLRHKLRDDADGSQRFFLSEQLANLFDQYLTYRPLMVLSWQKGEEKSEFQAVLWRQLIAQFGDMHFAARCTRFLNELSDEEIRSAVPKRVTLLGGPGLPPLYLQMLKRIGEVVPTRIFAFAVCEAYFADAHPLDQLYVDAEEDLHPLLVSLGRVGADFQRTMETVGGYEDGPAKFVLPDEKTQLGLLQRSLIRGTVGKASESTEDEFSSEMLKDGSLSLDSCHSRLREVEVLHDRLLGWFHDDPSLRPEDIVVLAPNIEEYSVLISAVFAARAGEVTKIPFRVADRSERSTNAAARTLLLGLSLLGSRFRASDVLDLFQEAPVRERYQIESTDLEKVATWVRASGIRWGVDGAHRQELGLTSDEANTWRSGLSRLLLGYALFDEGEQMFSGVVPLDQVGVSDLPLIGRFSQFCETLFALRERLSAAPAAGLTVGEWGAFLDDLFLALLPEDLKSGWDLAPIRSILTELRERPERIAAVLNPGQDARLGLFGMKHLLTAELEASRPSTDFLSGGVTFCTLLPLRTIPFRRVCVLGLNQGQFPRADVVHPLDLMASSPKHGDRSLRADDNYLFVEVLLAAREKLALSYIGRSVQDNAIQAPSTVVTELQAALRHLAEGASSRASGDELPSSSYLPAVEHPLQPFSARYFSTETGALRSFDREAYKAAQALSHPPVPVEAFVIEGETPTSEETVSEECSAEPLLELSLAELVSFWREPSRAFLSSRGVRIDDEVEQMEDREPIEPSPLESYFVGERYLAQISRGGAVHEEIELARGQLPVGRGGHELLSIVKSGADGVWATARQFAQGSERMPADLSLHFQATKSPSASVFQTEKRPIVLTGSIANIYDSCRVEASYGKLNPKRMLALWVQHLAVCALDLGVKESVFVGRAAPKAEESAEVLRLAALEPAAARDHLEILCRLALGGLRAPLRFFPGPSYVYMVALESPPKRIAEEEKIPHALRKAQDELVSVSTDKHVGELYRGREPLFSKVLEEGGSLEEASASFRELSEVVFRPLFAAKVSGDALMPTGEKNPNLTLVHGRKKGNS